MKTKTFDCVEMKRRIQAEMMSDYLAHRDEHTSYVTFVEARANASDWVRRMRGKFKPSVPSK